MNYYERHLGDYAKDTAHLSMLEHGAYGLLLDRYYATECGIPADQAHRLARARTKEEKQAVDSVLAEFFKLVDGVWINNRASDEITKAQSKIKAAQENGKRGGRPKTNQTETQEKPSGLFVGSDSETETKAHQTPDTRHQETLSPTALSGSTEKPVEPDPLPCPVEKIIEAYHEAMPLNPACKVLNDSRKRSIRQRWREASRMQAQPFGYSTQLDGLMAWRRFFEVCAESDFLTGRVPGRNGAPPFLADVDFLFSPSGFAKVLENKYHREVMA
jgi:uncharacterized protein YdaU (DUF1376 family)